MRRVILIAAFAALVTAKPEMYREKEDFQFSRKSSDEGSKSGYYGAQRGNMGGNYEKAHNMDHLAQHQMGGLIRQVEGELGDASNTKTGSVFTSSNSRGIYGNGHYDTSNLQGRNFQEGMTYGDSESARSRSSSQHNAAYSGSQSHDSRYRASGQLGQRLSHTNLGAGNEYDAAAQEDFNSGTFSQNGYHQQSAYEQSSLNQQRSSSGSNIKSRLVSRTPVRVIIRPGTQVDVPVAAQTYDASQSASSFDQNAVNRETELLSNGDHTNFKPTSNAKHYESAYKYHKEWEKHSGNLAPVPLAIPTENPFIKNGEFNENALGENLSENQHRASEINSQRAHSSNLYSGYNANVKSSSSSRSQSDYNTGYRSTAGSSAHDLASSDANFRSNADLTNIQGAHSEPKSYSSAYSYHKSWERQGDPYVIKPVGVYDGQTSQRLTSGALNSQSHQFGSHSQSHHQSYTHGGVLDCDCDEYGQIRQRRSVDQKPVNFDQHNQWKYDGQEDLGQQTQTGWDNLEDLGQQSQSSWDDGGQQTQNQWDKLEDLGQQSENKWDKFEDLGQQTQNKWDKIEDLGQQTQDKWDITEDLGQQTQNQQITVEDHAQNTQNFEKIPQSFYPSSVEHDQRTDDNLSTLNKKDHDHKNQRNGVKPFKQEKSDVINQNQMSENFQQIQSTWNKLGSFDLHRTENNNTPLEKKNHDTVSTHSIKNTWDKIDSLDVYHDTSVDKGSTYDHQFSSDSSDYSKIHNLNSNTWDKLDSAFYLYPEKINEDNSNKQKPLNTQKKETFDKENDQHIVNVENFNTSSTQPILSGIYTTWDKFNIISQNKTNNDNDKKTNQYEEQQKISDGNQGQQTNYENFNEQEFWSLIHELEQQSKEHLNQDTPVAEMGEGIDKNLWDHIQQFEQQSKYNTFQESQLTAGDTKYHNMYHNDKSIWDFINQVEKEYQEILKQEIHKAQENDNWYTNGHNVHNHYGPHGYSNDFLNSTHSNTQHINLNNLFEKIHNMEEQYSKYNIRDKNFNTNPQPTNNLYHQTYYSDLSTSNLAPNSYQPINEPPSDKYYPHNIHSNKGVCNTTDSKSCNDTYVTQTTIANNTTKPIESVNIKPESDRGDIHEQESSENLRPQDIGRGDIGAEDFQVKPLTTTEKQHKTNKSEFSFRYNSISSNLPNSYKTPEEIETLSLPKNMNETKPKSNEDNVNTNKEHLQQFESALNVLSISQQKLLEEERRHAATQFYKPSHSSSTTIKPNITENASKKRKVYENSNNKQFISSDNKENIQNNDTSEQKADTEQQNMKQYYERFDFGQQNENLDQQSDIQWEQNQDYLGQEVQESWNTNKNLQPQTQHIEDIQSFDENFNQKQNFNQENLFQEKDNKANNQKETVLKKKVEAEILTPLEPLDFGQQSENFDQQSDIQWEQNPETIRHNHDPSENIHLQTQDINSFNQNQNFYGEKYLPEKKDNVENIQKESFEQKNVEAELLSPPEVTTEKPGFWKSVGNKFTSAKDKVTSWFSRSR